MKVLVTGFKPFLKHRQNPSEIVASGLDGIMCGDIPVCAVVLPVKYSDCGRFVEGLYALDQYAAIIMLGLKARARLIQVERIAINVEDTTTPDMAGDIADNRIIVPSGPDGLFSTLPAKKLQKALEENGFRCRISNSAGTYVCNSLFYRMMFKLRTLNIPAGFIHLPPVSSTWPVERLTGAVRTAIATIFRLV